MKTARILFITFCCIGLILTSCHKKQGCTNPASINYDPTAEKDDGSCISDYREAFIGVYACIDSEYDSTMTFVSKTNFTQEVIKDDTSDSRVIFVDFDNFDESAAVTTGGVFSFGIVSGSFGSNSVFMEKD